MGREAAKACGIQRFKTVIYLNWNRNNFKKKVRKSTTAFPDFYFSVTYFQTIV